MCVVVVMAVEVEGWWWWGGGGGGGWGGGGGGGGGAGGGSRGGSAVGGNQQRPPSTRQPGLWRRAQLGWAVRNAHPSPGAAPRPRQRLQHSMQQRCSSAHAHAPCSA
jgi:hypothetical protein